MSHGRCVLWWGALMLLACLTGLSPGASAAQAEPRPIDLVTSGAHLALSSQLLMLEDPQQQLTAATALQRNDWHAVSARALTPGFTRSAIWLRGQLVNHGNQPVTRWLSVGVVRLEDVRFYRWSRLDAPPTEIRAGNREPLATRPVRSALSVFPVTLAPGEHIDFALRIYSRSSVSIVATLWQPEDFYEARQRELILELLMVGSMIPIGIYALCMSLVRRDRVFLLMALISVSDVAYDLAFQGFLYRFWLTGGGELVLRAPSVISTLTTVLICLLLLAFLGLHRIALWRRSYLALILLLLAGWVGALFGDYRSYSAMLVTLTVLVNLVWLTSALDAWRRGIANARLFLLAFSLPCFYLFLRLGFNLGLVHTQPFGGSEILWTNLGLLLLLIAVGVGRTLEWRRSKEQVQRELADIRTQEHERLQTAVQARTAELQTALIAADEANRAKSDFLARVSHDLRTPLTAIIGYADLVRVGGRDDAERGAIIHRSASHLKQMVNDLINYASGGSVSEVHPEPVYLHALLNGIDQESEALARTRGNQFALHTTPGLPPVVMLDPKRIRQVLGNLIDNANKFTHAGWIRLHVSQAPASDTEATVLLFAVSDSGCGIAASDQQRIFEPFQRLASAHQGPSGVGLGLAIVQQWVARMAGTIELVSEPGAGTTFTVRIPVQVVDERRLEPAHLQAAIGAYPRLAGHHRRLWLIDDTPEILHFLADELADQDFVVERFADGEAALARLHGDGPWPDLVLTDYMMSGADGAAVRDAVHARLPDVPVVLLSAVPVAPVTAGVRNFDACLLKPLDLAALHRVLAELLEPGRVEPATAPHVINGPLVKPPPSQLAHLRSLIEQGAISDLLDWAHAQGGLPHQTFAAAVAKLAAATDLSGLHTLCME